MASFLALSSVNKSSRRDVLLSRSSFCCRRPWVIPSAMARARPGSPGAGEAEWGGALGGGGGSRGGSGARSRPISMAPTRVDRDWTAAGRSWRRSRRRRTSDRPAAGTPPLPPPEPSPRAAAAAASAARAAARSASVGMATVPSVATGQPGWQCAAKVPSLRAFCGAEARHVRGGCGPHGTKSGRSVPAGTR